MSVKRIIALWISIIWWCADRGMNTLRMLTGQSKISHRICLYYHGVTDLQRDRFARQMEWLRSTFAIVETSQIFTSTGNRPQICITFDDALDSVRRNALPVLQEKNIPACIFVVTGNLGEKPLWSMPPDHPDAEDCVMSAEQLKSLPANLIELGSHTVTHPDLRSLSASDLRKELVESKQALESILDRKVSMLSVPYGLYHEETMQAAGDAGYTQVFTSDPLVIRQHRPAMGIGRFGVTPDDWIIEFRLKAAGAYQWRRMVQRWKQRYFNRKTRSPGNDFSPVEQAIKDTV